MFAATICGWLAYRFLQRERRPLIPRAIILVVIPMMLGVAGIAAAQMWYNEATTGNFALMPYQIWRESQDMTPMFLWQSMEMDREFYNSGALRFAVWNMVITEDITKGGLRGLLFLVSRHGVTFRDLLGPFLFLAFACWSPRWIGTPATLQRTREYLGVMCIALIFLAVCGPAAGSIIKLLAVFVLIKRWANQNERLAILVLLIGMVATSLPSFYMNVYFAAYTAPMLLLVATGLGNLARWHRPLGAGLAGFVLLGATLVPIGYTIGSAVALLIPGYRADGPTMSHFDHHFANPRGEVMEKLEQMPGQHVVFVQLTQKATAPYDPTWNAPDVDAQKVVWLRDLKPEWTATALEYYAGRTFWVIRVNSRGDYQFEPFEPREGVKAAPIESLPNPDRIPAESLGARVPED
ncbi:MAG: hypothetical protein AAF127_15530 [Pseudomonadota bacterium]